MPLRYLPTIFVQFVANGAVAQQLATVDTSCRRRTVHEAYTQASLVLVGKVLNSEDYQQQLIIDTSRTRWRMHRVTLEVLRGWKGQPRDTIMFDTSPPEEDSGATIFVPNQTYIVYLYSEFDASRRRREELSPIEALLWNRPTFLRCSRSANVAHAGEDLRYLGKPKWRRR